MLEIAIIDAFADRPFGGNPAAVVWLDEPLAEGQHRAIAAEMNLSETAFVWPVGDTYELRWFTPTQEVDLCGHATLATAWFLRERGLVPPYGFATRSGALTATVQNGQIRLDFPAMPTTACPPPLAQALSALGVEPLGLAGPYALGLLPAEAAVVNFQPNLGAIAALPAAQALVITAPAADTATDFVSRFLPRPWASPKTPSPARPIAAWGPTGAIAR
ncbi:MAG: PhzF family phenazine biosynthesis protein, partial [Oscillatoriales cyanobacterium SM2_1_8]|nr:PhzF family phenazine biosynthesis protein [Oscillatoriales cyanobacterium SM2_1_8]